MPAEWETHARCVMAFSSAWNHFDAREIDAIRAEQAVVAKAIRQFEPVTMLTNAEDMEDARQLCGNDIDLLELAHYDIWSRDTLPTVVHANSGLLWAIGWNFNVWGEAYDGYDSDRDLAERFAERSNFPFRQSSIVTEPGAFDVDGAGTVITTETALLDPRRNDGATRTDVEEEFRRFLGAENVIWLKGSESDVITDGHVDGLAKLLAPGKAVVEITDDPDDPEYKDLQENRRRFEEAAYAGVQSFEIHPVLRPRREYLPAHGDDFAASYVNCYIANGGIVMPRFGDWERDEAAKDLFSKLSGGLPVVQVSVHQICEGGGGIHCNTQQIPAPKRTHTPMEFLAPESDPDQAG